MCDPLDPDLVAEILLARYAYRVCTAALAVPEYVDIFLCPSPCAVDLGAGRSGIIFEFMLRDERDNIVNGRARFLDGLCDLLDVLIVDADDEDEIF